MRKLLIAISILLCLSVVGQAFAYELITENYALGKSTSASDTGYGWLPSRAVDGNGGSGYHSTETDDIDHWWEVDMGAAYDFDRIEVLNRPNFFARLNGAVVIALDADRNVVFTGPAITEAGLLAVYDNNGAGFASVRYIRVEQNGPILTLMEVRAIDVAFESNIIPYGNIPSLIDVVATQNVSNDTYPASRAVDGNYTNFTHTDATSPGNYWKVDLTDTFFVDKLVIYNRTSCCGSRLLNVTVSVMDEAEEVIYSYKFTEADGVAAKSVHTLQMPGPVFARYVKIGLENGDQNGDPGNAYVISLAEVEIIGGQYIPISNQLPADGAVEIAPEQILSWAGGEDPNGLITGTTGYNVYIDTDRDAVARRDEGLAGGFVEVGNESFDPELAKDTTYYWVVDQRLQDDANSVPGVVWSFTTELTLPIIDTPPAPVVTIEGGYAKFGVAATDPLGGELAYAWRKMGDGAVLSTTDTLELMDVTAADEGQYVCDIMNINTLTTEPVSLTIAKPVVDWKFNETSGAVATDSSGNGIDGALGTAFTDADWIVGGGRTGQPGDNALYFPGDPNAAVLALNVDLTGKDVDNVFAGASSWTVVMWVNFDKVPTKVTNLGGFGACESAEGDPFDDRYFAAWSDGVLEFEYGGWGVWPGTALQAEQWQMLAVAYDAAARQIRMFYNGQQVAAPADPITLIDTTENSFKINPGTEVLYGPGAALQGMLKGLIDDFSVWDAALGTFELEMLTKGYGCFEQLAGDANDDCKVNVADLAALVSGWLDCAIIPGCL